MGGFRFIELPLVTPFFPLNSCTDRYVNEKKQQVNLTNRGRTMYVWEKNKFNALNIITSSTQQEHGFKHRHLFVGYVWAITCLFLLLF